MGDTAKPVLKITPRRSNKVVGTDPESSEHDKMPVYKTTTSISPWWRGRKPPEKKEQKSAWLDILMREPEPADPVEARYVGTMAKIASLTPSAQKTQIAEEFVKLASSMPVFVAQRTMAALQALDPSDEEGLTALYKTAMAPYLEDDEDLP